MWGLVFFAFFCWFFAKKNTFNAEWVVLNLRFGCQGRRSGYQNHYKTCCFWMILKCPFQWLFPDILLFRFFLTVAPFRGPKPTIKPGVLDQPFFLRFYCYTCLGNYVRFLVDFWILDFRPGGPKIDFFGKVVQKMTQKGVPRPTLKKHRKFSEKWLQKWLPRRVKKWFSLGTVGKKWCFAPYRIWTILWSKMRSKRGPKRTLLDIM